MTEYRNAYFEVQWSVDGINFNDIGLVNGYGTTYLHHSYPFLHKQPVTGNNYYRLKQVYEDSSFLYSAIIPVNVDSFIQQIPKNKFIYVFPNPSVSGEFNVDYYNPQNITTKIKVYDLIGKLVYTDEWTVFSGISHYLLKLKDLPKGTYLLNVEDEMVKIQK